MTSQAIRRTAEGAGTMSAVETAMQGLRAKIASGELQPGQVLGIGPRSLELRPDGIALPVTSQGFALGEVEIGVALPDGQRATCFCQLENGLSVRPCDRARFGHRSELRFDGCEQIRVRFGVYFAT